MSGTNARATAPPPHAAVDPRGMIDAVMFPCDVNEVFLLIDHISGRSEKSLKDLDTTGIVLPPPFTAGETAAAQAPTAADATSPAAAAPPQAPAPLAPPQAPAPLAPPQAPAAAPAPRQAPAAEKPSVAEILEALCQIGAPPDPDPPTKARKVAFILLLKDRLNALATPARGITVAYTAIFIAATDGCSWRFWRGATSRNQAAPVRRGDLAKAAYPGLEVHARCFALLFRRFPWLMALVLLLTASAYWDVGFSRTIVQRIEQLDAQRTEVLRPDRRKSPDAATVAPAACKAGGAAAADQAQACALLDDLDSQLNDSRRDLYNFALSAAGTANDRWFWRALSLLRPIHYGFVFTGQAPLAGRPETSVAWVLSLFSTYVLPGLFGFLGTLAAITRAIQGKVRDSLLGPRDLPLSVLGLFIGPMAGLAVGLYYTPSGTAVTGTTGLAGAVSLSASGLGFLAGYGADAFFKFADALLIRVFALDQSGK